VRLLVSTSRKAMILANLLKASLNHAFIVDP
jgi:hypothetical protein